MEPDVAEAFASGFALSAWASGTCLGAAGVFPHWPGRGEAWALMSPAVGAYLLPCVRMIRTVLDNQPQRRIDMAVLRSNKAGHKLAKLAGFEFESWAEAYHVTGEDMAVYKRIRH